jgi:nucleotide-binding universal stress UspA family protein
MALDGNQNWTFHSIAVGFDGSAHGRDGLALAQLLAGACHARLTAACVYAFEPIHRVGDDEIEAALREDALLRARLASELAELPGVRAVAVRGHSACEGLQRVAQTLPADLLVVGATRHSAAAPRAFVSVPEHVLHGAPCAVAIAPHGFADRDPAPRLRTIGVGFDGGPESLLALGRAAALARVTEARLEVITAVAPHVPVCMPPAVAEIAYAEHLADGRARLEELQRRAVAGLTDVVAVAVTDEREPRDALVARSRGLDLLVLGSRCYGPWRRLMLGSVSTQVVRHAECPLLLLPRSALAREANRGEPARDMAARLA